MKILGKNNKTFNFYLERLKDSVCQFVIVNDHGELMGELTFRIKDSKAWLYSIAAIPEYQHMGVGQTLIDLFECHCAEHCCDVVEGRYIPSNDHAYSFYQKNNYKVYKDGYDQFIYKKLNIKQILNSKHVFVKEDSLLEF